MYQAGWWPDPGRRHQLRYHDGKRWTEHVSDNGFVTNDSYGLPDVAPPNGPYLPPMNPHNPPSTYRSVQVPGTHPYGQQVAPYFIAAGTTPQRSNGPAVASLVLGILAAVTAFLPFFLLFAIVFGIVGLVFGLVGWSAADKGASNKGLAIAGTVLSLIGICLVVIWIVILDQIVSHLGQ